jgi:hypothetical protein
MLVTAQLRNCEQIIRCLDTLQEFSSECWMRFSMRGWYVQVANPYGIASCELCVKPTRFDEFQLSDERDTVDYFINISQLMPHLVKFKDDKSVVLKMNSLPNDQLEFSILFSKVVTSSAASASASGKPSSSTQSITSFLTPTSVTSGGGGARSSVVSAAARRKTRGGGSGGSGVPVSMSIVTSGTSRKRQRLFHDAPGVQRRAHIEKHSFVLPSKTDHVYRSEFLAPSDDVMSDVSSSSSSSSSSNPPPMVDARLDANNLNTIFRESSVVNKAILFAVHVETNQLLMYTRGETGEIVMRVTGTDRMQSKSDVQLNVTAPPTMTTVTEHYSNRSIKFFSKIMIQSLTANMSFTPGKPLVMAIDLNQNVRIAAKFGPWYDPHQR